MGYEVMKEYIVNGKTVVEWSVKVNAENEEHAFSQARERFSEIDESIAFGNIDVDSVDSDVDLAWTYE